MQPFDLQSIRVPERTRNITSSVRCGGVIDEHHLVHVVVCLVVGVEEPHCVHDHVHHEISTALHDGCVQVHTVVRPSDERMECYDEGQMESYEG